MTNKTRDKNVGSADEFSVVTLDDAKKKKDARQKELADWIKQNKGKTGNDQKN